MRIQLSRKKGWRLPPNTVVVSRPSKWGNPCAEDGKEHGFNSDRFRRLDEAQSATAIENIIQLPDLIGKRQEIKEFAA